MVVKAGRARGTRREVNLAATRAHVVDAARRLFLAKGFASTTLEAIAAEAGVAVQTIYNGVGNKAALLTAVFEAVVSGAEAGRTAPVIMRERTARASDARELVRVLAGWLGEVHARTAPMWKALDEAAAQDVKIARFVRERAHLRLQHYREAGEALRRLGGPGTLEPEDAAALIWSAGHPQVYRTLVLEAGWSAERYRRWLEVSLSAALAPG